MPLGGLLPYNTGESAQNMIARLRGMKDSRGVQGMLSRGRNVYNAGSPQAHSGGGAQFGRPVGSPSMSGPMQQLAQRRMQMAMKPPATMAGGGAMKQAATRRVKANNAS